MNKLDIAKKLLKNTKNIHLNFFIEEYINNFNGSEIKNKKHMDFDKCIEYINKSKFDVTEWGLWEIPLPNIYIFYNKNRKEFFDLIIDDKKIIPSYIDKNYNSIQANSIQAAIEKYTVE